MPVAIRNLDGSTVSLSSRDRSTDALTWAPNGDAGGDDVQYVSDAFAKESVQLMKALGLGILGIVDDDEASAALQAQANRYRGTRKAVDDGVELLVVPSAQGDVKFSEDELNAHIDRISKGQPSHFNPAEEH